RQDAAGSARNQVEVGDVVWPPSPIESSQDTIAEVLRLTGHEGRRAGHVLDGQVFELGGELLDREGTDGAGELGQEVGGLCCGCRDRVGGIALLPRGRSRSRWGRGRDKC